MCVAVSALTQDPRDLTLDHEVSPQFCPRASRDAGGLDEIAPASDEIRVREASSSLSVPTVNLYVLANPGVKYCVIAGALTGKCVDSAQRGACDRGDLATAATEARATVAHACEERVPANNRVWRRQLSTNAIFSEVSAFA